MTPKSPRPNSEISDAAGSGLVQLSNANSKTRSRLFGQGVRHCDHRHIVLVSLALGYAMAIEGNHVASLPEASS